MDAIFKTLAQNPFPVSPRGNDFSGIEIIKKLSHKLVRTGLYYYLCSTINNNNLYNMSKYSYADLAKMIDHSLLKPNMTDTDIKEGCAIAKKYDVASVCVRPSDVLYAAQLLKGTTVAVSTVIGFPHGTTTTLSKVTEAQEAINNGCVELDMVLNIGKLRSGEFEYVKREIAAVVNVAHAASVKVKVIFENCYLTKEEIKKATLICNEMNADWVKTSTGYGTSGALDEDLNIMRENMKPGVQLKAAGGVRTLERLIEVKELGCTRAGATATIDILEKFKDPNYNPANKPTNY
jgi:deoxyribose-phosphate aldolase